MFKLAGRVFDSYDDPRFVGHPALGSDALPSLEQVQELPDRDFALIIKTASGESRKFPIATPELVQLSAAYFGKTAAYLTPDMAKVARNNLLVAADRMGLDLELEGPTMPGHVVPVATQLDDMGTKIADVSPTQRAEDEILHAFDRMAPVDRARAANELAKVAEIHDPRVLDYVVKTELGPKLASGIRDRLSLLRDDPVKTASLERVLVQMRNVDPGRAAMYLHQFDKLAGYAGRVPDAFVTCWGGGRKQAAMANVDPHSYRIETLATAHADQIRRVFDAKIADAFLRDPTGYFATASGQVKRVLRNLAAQVGRENPGTEVRREELPDATRAIRHGTRTPWSKADPMIDLRGI